MMKSDRRIEVIDLFLDDISDEYFVGKLKDILRINGFGKEFAACEFSHCLNQQDEDYFGDRVVKISLEYPVYSNDITIIVPYNVFFDRLVIRADRFLKNNPNQKIIVCNLLLDIEKKYDIKK